MSPAQLLSTSLLDEDLSGLLSSLGNSGLASPSPSQDISSPDEQALAYLPSACMEQVDEPLRLALSIWFPDPKRHGLEFVQALIQQASIMQIPLVPGQPSVPVAVLTCQAITDLLKLPGWKWSRETTLIMLQALEALGILIRFRRAGQTHIHLPLGPRQFDQEEMLASLMTSPHTHRKAQRLFANVAERIRVCPWPWSQEQIKHQREGGTHVDTLSSRNETRVSPSLSHKQMLLRMLEEEGVSHSIRARVAYRLTYARSLFPHAHVPDVSPNHPKDECPVQITPSRETHTDPIQQESGHEQTILTDEQSSSSPSLQQPLTIPPQQSPSDNRANAASPQQGPPAWEKKAGKEALAIWRQLLDTPTRSIPEGVHFLHRLEQWLQEHPELVRAAMINTLMQRVFPDRYGPPAYQGAGWFTSTYKRYCAQTLVPSAHIASWDETGWTYDQIEQALWQERRIQEQEGGKLRRPYAPTPADKGPTRESELEDRSLPQVASSFPPEEIIEVESAAIGWPNHFMAQRWLNMLVRTPVAEISHLRLASTQYGCCVIAMNYHDTPERTWIWTHSGEVKSYLADCRAAYHAMKEREQINESQVS